jgi:hypothetical protein
MKRSDYPDDWEEASARVRFGRANSRCEWPGCGVRHGSIIARGKDGEPVRDALGMAREFPSAADPALADFPEARPVAVVLTAHHVCTCRPKCAIDEHLKALCQRCHNRVDAPLRRAHAKLTRWVRKARKGGQALLFDFSPEITT